MCCIAEKEVNTFIFKITRAFFDRAPLAPPKVDLKTNTQTRNRPQNSSILVSERLDPGLRSIFGVPRVPGALRVLAPIFYVPKKFVLPKLIIFSAYSRKSTVSRGF